MLHAKNQALSYTSKAKLAAGDTANMLRQVIGLSVSASRLSTESPHLW